MRAVTITFALVLATSVAPAFAQVTQIWAETPPTALNKGYEALNNGDPELALKYLERAAEAKGTAEMARLLRAQAFVSLDRYPDAQRELLQILAANPGNMDARRTLAVIQIFMQDGESAETLLTPLIDAKKNGRDYFNRARARALQGDLELALEDTAQAIAAEKDLRQAYYLRANLLEMTQQGAQIPALASQLQKRSVGTDQGFFHAAILLMIAGRREEALQFLDEGNRKRPGADSLIYRARLRDDSDAAVADIERAVRQEPNSDLIVVGAVRALLDIHRYKEALEYADRLRGKSKWALENLNYRGIALWQQGDHEAAMAMFEEARAMATKAKQLSDLCWDKASLGAALEQALLDCDAALAMESSYQFALDSKGFTLLRLGRLEDSLSVYDKALSISPTKTAFYGRGVARTRLGSTEEGLRDIRIAQILDPVVGEMFRGYGITP